MPQQTEIKPGLTRVQAQAEADGEFSITFTTNIDQTTNDANAVLNTAYNAIDDNDFTAALKTANDAIDGAGDNDADDAAIATAINTALTTFRTAITGLDDVGTSADSIIDAVSFLKDDGTPMRFH